MQTDVDDSFAGTPEPRQLLLADELTSEFPSPFAHSGAGLDAANFDAGYQPRADDAIAALTEARVMMIDDDPVLIEVIQATLEDVGYCNITTTTSPAESLDLMKSVRPDVLFLDMVMPDIDGLTLLKLIQAEPSLKRTPVIVLTASSDPAIKLRALELGAADFLAKPVDPSELVLRLRNTLAAKAYRDRLAYSDPVTGLPNRRMLIDRLDWSCRYARRYGKRGALLHIDIDRFKQVNEALGPRAGDALLRQIGDRVSQCVRASDALGRLGQDVGGPTLSRLGGDEFTVLFPDVACAEDVAGMAQRILDAIQSAPFHEGEHEVFLTATIGAAVFPDDGADVDVLLKHAGAALHEAKNEGRQRYRFFSKEFNARALRRLTIESDLRRALERDELSLHFQPKVRTLNGKVCGAEALLRWRHPLHGMVPPGEFIPVAEASGLIVPIGDWVLHSACRQFAEWRDAGIVPVPLSVNVSAIQLRDLAFVPRLEHELSQAGLRADEICVELTETVILDQSSRTAQALAQLRELGIKLSIDDFGVGYTSLAYLKNLPFSELKIDRSFINDIGTDSGSVAIVAAVIALAQTLGLTVVAEGVETTVQQAVLQAKGCDECQGYLFSRPMSADDFTRYLLQSHALNRVAV